MTAPGHQQAEVDRRARSPAAPRRPAELPQVAGGCGELEPERPAPAAPARAPGSRSPRCASTKPMRCLIRSVCSLYAPTASAMSWPCAKSSMIPALARIAGGSGLASQGTVWPGGTAASAAVAAARSVRQRPSSCRRRVARYGASAASTAPSKSPAAPAVCAWNAAGSAAASSASLTIEARWATWCATVQPGAGVGNGHCCRIEARHELVQALAFGDQVGVHVVRRRSRSSSRQGGHTRSGSGTRPRISWIA